MQGSNGYISGKISPNTDNATETIFNSKIVISNSTNISGQSDFAELKKKERGNQIMTIIDDNRIKNALSADALSFKSLSNNQKNDKNRNDSSSSDQKHSNSSKVNNNSSKKVKSLKLNSINHLGSLWNLEKRLSLAKKISFDDILYNDGLTRLKNCLIIHTDGVGKTLKLIFDIQQTSSRYSFAIEESSKCLKNTSFIQQKISSTRKPNNKSLKDSLEKISNTSANISSSLTVNDGSFYPFSRPDSSLSASETSKLNSDQNKHSNMTHHSAISAPSSPLKQPTSNFDNRIGMFAHPDENSLNLNQNISNNENFLPITSRRPADNKNIFIPQNNEQNGYNRTFFPNNQLYSSNLINSAPVFVPQAQKSENFDKNDSDQYRQNYLNHHTLQQKNPYQSSFQNENFNIQQTSDDFSNSMINPQSNFADNKLNFPSSINTDNSSDFDRNQYFND